MCERCLLGRGLYLDHEDFAAEGAERAVAKGRFAAGKDGAAFLSRVGTCHDAEDRRRWR